MALRYRRTLGGARRPASTSGPGKTARSAYTRCFPSAPETANYGLKATRRITTDSGAQADTRLVLTTFEIDEYVFGALDARASGFLLKGGEPADLVRAIQVVAAGDSLLAPSVTHKLIETYTSRPHRQDPPLTVLIANARALRLGFRNSG